MFRRKKIISSQFLKAIQFMYYQEPIAKGLILTASTTSSSGTSTSSSRAGMFTLDGRSGSGLNSSRIIMNSMSSSDFASSGDDWTMKNIKHCLYQPRLSSCLHFSNQVSLLHSHYLIPNDNFLCVLVLPININFFTFSRINISNPSKHRNTLHNCFGKSMIFCYLSAFKQALFTKQQISSFL